MALRWFFKDLMSCSTVYCFFPFIFAGFDGASQLPSLLEVIYGKPKSSASPFLFGPEKPPSIPFIDLFGWAATWNLPNFLQLKLSKKSQAF